MRGLLRRSSRWHAWPIALIALAGIAALLRQWLEARALWLDEEMIAINIRDRGFLDLAGPLWLGQSAPLGWLFAERLMLLVFGAGEMALRALPVFFGAATIVAAAVCGRRFLTSTGAIVLVLLLGIGTWISFHALELKPYSSDVFWALLLPFLAEWAADSPVNHLRASGHRLVIWWSVAAIGQWFGNGALFATPACAVALLVVMTRRGGWPAAMKVAAPGVLWLVMFALHYALSLRHTQDSQALQQYWQFAFPPSGADLTATLNWLADQLRPLAAKPGGTEHWVTLWATAAVGLALLVPRRPVMTLAFALVPLTAFALAAFRIVPLYERLSLWIVPALYVGVAAAADAAIRAVGRFRETRAMPSVALATPLALAVALVCYNISANGWGELGYRLQLVDGNHEVNDRDGVRWLMGERQPGDIVLTTRFALPAVWWYGRARLDDPNAGTTVPTDLPVFQLTFDRDAGCRPDDLERAAKGHSRALIYLGFRAGDVPKGFDEFLFNRAGELGQLVGYREYAETGRSAVVDFREPPLPTGVMGPVRLSGRPEDVGKPLQGCLGVQPAKRW